MSSDEFGIREFILIQKIVQVIHINETDEKILLQRQNINKYVHVDLATASLLQSVFNQQYPFYPIQKKWSN